VYLRGLLTDGQRKSMVAMAARLGTDHQRLQQFITSSAWDYAAVRGECRAVVRRQPAITITVTARSPAARPVRPPGRRD
jgi:SRSO17 transposase